MSTFSPVDIPGETTDGAGVSIFGGRPPPEPLVLTPPGKVNEFPGTVLGQIIPCMPALETPGVGVPPFMHLYAPVAVDLYANTCVFGLHSGVLGVLL